MMGAYGVRANHDHIWATEEGRLPRALAPDWVVVVTVRDNLNQRINLILMAECQCQWGHGPGHWHRMLEQHLSVRGYTMSRPEVA